MTVLNYPVSDADSAPWWGALQERRLLIQQCQDCQRLRWPARAMCNDCGSIHGTWVPATGSGTIASWTVTHPPGPTADPYVVVVVRLDDQDDIFLPGFVDGPTDGLGLCIGMPVEVGFDEVEVGNDGWGLVVLHWHRSHAT